MGGIAGRADAIFGAVECQKSNGSLHFHFFQYIQRLHQFASMKEIASILKEKLVSAVELKQFLENICVESYADPAQHDDEVPKLEAAFPLYSEVTECSSKDKTLMG